MSRVLNEKAPVISVSIRGLDTAYGNGEPSLSTLACTARARARVCVSNVNETKLCLPLSSLSPFVHHFETGSVIPGLIRASTILSRKILASPNPLTFRHDEYLRFVRDYEPPPRSSSPKFPAKFPPTSPLSTGWKTEPEASPRPVTRKQAKR